MSSALKQKNANRTYIVGLQCTVKLLRNVCQCILKLHTIDMDGIKMILVKSLLMILKKMGNTVKQV